MNRSVLIGVMIVFQLEPQVVETTQQRDLYEQKKPHNGIEDFKCRRGARYHYMETDGAGPRGLRIDPGDESCHPPGWYPPDVGEHAFQLIHDCDAPAVQTGV